MKTIHNTPQPPSMHPDHLSDLRRSGLSDETIQYAGIQSVPPGQINRTLGFNVQGLTSMYRIPYDKTFARYRCFYEDGKIGPKYLQKKGSGNRLYISKDVEPILQDQLIPLYITEGEKKTLKACQEGIHCIGLSGLWNWSNGGGELIDDFKRIRLYGRFIYIVPDNDWLKPNKNGYKKNLSQAVYRLAHRLMEHGANVKIVMLPEGPLKGLDDYLCKFSKDDFFWLAEELVQRSSNGEIVEIVEIVDVVDINSDQKLLPEYPFPQHIFPDEFENLIAVAAESLSVDHSHTCTVALAVTSAAIGNSIRISPKSDWKVPPFIWSVLVGNSGQVKTPTINTFTKAVSELQGIAWSKHKAEMAAYLNAKKTTRKPVPTHYIVQDSTVPALANVFNSAPRGILMYQDELSGLIYGMDQYKGGKGNDRQHYLELFDALPWKIDRVIRGSDFIRNTGAAIIGGIQPQVLVKVFNATAFDDGLCPRFIFDLMPDRPMKYSDKSIDSLHLEHWKSHLRRCYGMKLTINADGFVEPQILLFEETAHGLWVKFHDELGIMGMHLSDKARIFIPKLSTYSLKFCGILHCINRLDDKGNLPALLIDEETTQGAIELTRFYAGRVGRLLKLYGTQEFTLSEPEERLIRALYDLRDQVKNGKLALSVIRDYYNRDRLENLQLPNNNKTLSSMLRTFGLKSKEGTGGVYYLLWKVDVMNNIFSKHISTKSTTSTMSTTLNLETIDDETS